MLKTDLWLPELRERCGGSSSLTKVKQRQESTQLKNIPYRHDCCLDSKC